MDSFELIGSVQVEDIKNMSVHIDFLHILFSKEQVCAVVAILEGIA